ncbi:MAG: hypothetical protein KDC34_10605 [Saprospiraceae bacterium]|nr:hypothetical protein [Saprospiraceae bacterium]
MKHIQKLSVGLLLLSIMAFTSSMVGNLDCSILHKGTFTYNGSDGLVEVVIKGKSHIEYHNNGKFYIKSKIKWLNECEYDMTLKEVTLPNFPYSKGEVMHVKIDGISGNKIYFISTINGENYSGVLTKID